MEHIHIRDAVPEDAARLVEIYDYYVRHTAVSFEYDTPTAEEFRERMERTMACWPYLVAERDGRVMGYAYAGAFVGRAAYDRCCELSIYLDRDARRGGLGRRLYQELSRRLADRGILNLYACIGCPIQRDDPYLTWDSVNFHRRMGFTLAGTFHACGYKFGRWYDMVWMEKLIGPHYPARPPAGEPCCQVAEEARAVQTGPGTAL